MWCHQNKSAITKPNFPSLIFHVDSMKGRKTSQRYQITSTASPGPNEPTTSRPVRNILSFDGGGTKGIIELSVLQDVMRLATIIWKLKPTLTDKVKLNEGNPQQFLDNQKAREKLIEDLKSEDVTKELIQPNEVYDMIAGTSVGALIAFALAGGKKGKEGERLPMTLDECTDIYLKYAKKITWSVWRRIILSILGICHPKREFINILNETFHDSRLSDFQQKRRNREHVIPFTQVREVLPESKLVSFDGNDQDNGNIEIREVLKGATNVPILFYNRVEIKGRLVVDGGIGGNCPIGQAIFRAMETFNPEANDISKLSVLSIAPPRPDIISRKRKTHALTWLRFLFDHISDGNFLYENVKRQHRGKAEEIMFRRLVPRGNKLKNIGLFDYKVHQIVDEMNSEKKENKMFLVDIIAIGTFVLQTYLARNPASISSNSDATKRLKDAATLAYIAGKAYETANENRNTFDSYITCLDLYGMTQKPLKPDDKAFEEVFLSLRPFIKQEIDFKEASRRFVEAQTKLMKLPDSGIKAALLVELTHYLIKPELTEIINILGKALKIQKDNKNMPEAANIYSKIALVYSKNDNYPVAVKYEMKALRIRKNPQYLLDEKDRNISMAESLASLVEYHFARKELVDAIECFIKYLNVTGKRSFWNPDKTYAECLKNGGECFFYKKEYEKAMNYLQRALAILQGLYNIYETTPLTAEICAIMALCLIKLDEGDKSLKYANDAVATAKKHYKDVDHPLIVKTLFIRSEIYEKRGTNPINPIFLNLAQEDKKSAEEMRKRLNGNK